MFLAIFIVRD